MTPGRNELVPEVGVGHWTGAGTGVTVVLCPADTVGSGEVRGGAPATRETALLAPERSVEHVDAVVFSGGSAFGLATADGVMAWLVEHDRGFPTSGGRVPIVPTAAIFDLTASRRDPAPPRGVLPSRPRRRVRTSRPDAWVARPARPSGSGGVGEHAVPGGLGIARASVDDATIGAVAVVNPVGDVVEADGRPIAASAAPEGAEEFPDVQGFGGEATTLVALATDARCTKTECFLLAQSGHVGLGHAVRPSHTRHDGDLVVALATGRTVANLDRLRVAAADRGGRGDPWRRAAQ